MTDAADAADGSPPSVPVAVVGAGAVGSALGRRMVERGYRVRAVLSRRREPAEALADRLGAGAAGTDAGDLPADVRAVFVCVPDDAIDEVAAALAAVDHPWERTLAAHTSGARTAAALAPLADAGSRTLSFHPMQTFTADTPPSAFDDVVVGLEGDPDAVAFAEAMVEALGARPVVLTAAEKTRYHCAAALASNGLVALMAAVREVLATAGIEGDDADALIRPLVDRTWQNLQSASPEAALTGPAARGDRGTVAAHVDALADAAPHLVPLYVALTTEMTQTALRGGRLDGEDAADLLDVLQQGLHPEDERGDEPGEEGERP